MALFSERSSGIRHDFPSNLEYFQQVTRGHLGTLDDVLRFRTAFGFYAPFLSSAVARKVIDALTGRSRVSPRRILGLHKSGLVIHSPLKACQDCVKDQLQRFQFSYWKNWQQLPTVNVCIEHHRVLDIANDDVHLPETREWILPHDLSDRNWKPKPAISTTCFEHAVDLQRWTEYLLSFTGGRFDEHLLRHTYRLQAQRRGWVTMAGTIRLLMLRDAFQADHLGLASLPGLAFVEHVGGANAGFLGLLFRQYAGLRHPAKHIVLLRFLFGDPCEFFSTYEYVERAGESGDLPSIETKLKGQLATVVNLIQEQGYSVNAASKQIGLPPSQVIQFLRRNGMTYNRRPRVLTADLRKQLEAMLMAGAERRHIAKALGIRLAFIKDFLAEQPELRITWGKVSKSLKHTRYRSQFLTVLESNPGVPLKRIRRIRGNGFEWLYRNDLEWLKMHLPEIWRRP